MNRSAFEALLAENIWLILPYYLPLRNRLTTQRQSDSFRKGFLLLWQSNVGVVYGEIAPLPGLHSESLDETKLFVHDYFPRFIKLLETSNDIWLDLKYPNALAPSIKFGFQWYGF